MHEKDYVLRIVSQAAAALKRILALRQAGEYDQALLLVESSLQEYVGVPSVLVGQIDADDLVELLNPGGMLNIDKSMLLAAFLKEQGDIHAAQNKPTESQEVYRKSLVVALGSLLKADKALCHSNRSLIDALAEELGPSGTGDDLNDQLSQFYEKVGDRATASTFFRRLLR